MRRARVLSAAAALVLFWAPCAAEVGATADRVEKADAAFARGDLAEALKLYEAVLAERPDHIHALVRSAKLYSWDRRFDEALERYARVLALEPGHREARLERAKVLSWAGRYREAEQAFEALLGERSDDLEARLGLARTLSWSGRQQAARAHYLRVLEQDPGNAAAMVGMAQTYAWSGRPAEARRWYQRALGVEPGMKDALLGLAYLDLQQGRRERAARRAEELAARFPSDREVAELRRATQAGRGSGVRSSFDRVDDTDDNRLELSRLEWAVPAHHVALRVGWIRASMRSPGGSASVDSAYAVVGRALAGHRVDLRLGADRRTFTGGDRETEAVGGVTYRYDFNGGAHVTVSVERRTFVYSPEILDGPGNTVRAEDVRFRVPASGAWDVFGGAGHWAISDGNERRAGDVGVEYRWPVDRVQVSTGYRFRFMDYEQDLNHGYFDPSDFSSHLVELRVRDRWRRAYADLRLEGGLQSFTLGGVEVTNDQVLGGSGLLGFPLGGGVALEFYLQRTNYAAQTASGFRSRQVGIRLRWQSEGRP